MTEPAGRAGSDRERLYRRRFEQSADVIAVFDLDSRPLDVSPTVYQLRGYARAPQAPVPPAPA
jgi:PAS domain S-box-containing protein